MSPFKKRLVGGIVGLMLTVIGALFGVNIDKLKGHVTDEVVQAVIEGKGTVSLDGIVLTDEPAK